MQKITTFTFVSLDGYYAGPHDKIDWFKGNGADPEYDAFSHAGSEGGGALIFGHRTYEMMKSYWPTPAALSADPAMARVVNSSPKIVFSRSMQKAEEGPNWKNIKLVHDIKPAEITRLKEQEPKHLTILGSGSIVQQLSNLGLVDEYGLLVIPVIVGAGKYLFKDLDKKGLELLETRTFKNGIVWLRYQAAK